MKMRGVLVLLSMLTLCGAQKWKKETSVWDPKAYSHTNTCSNLTQILDNWKFAIMTQVKDLLVNDHASVLPDYNRIQPLSEALVDLYKLFNSLKDELGRLTNKFDRVEAFVDDLQAGKYPPPPMWTASQRPMQRFPPRAALRPPLRAQMRAPERVNSQGLRAARMRGRRVPCRP